ncbi:HVA22-like protein [Quillaja saponaria]|uniref:HVA22-like protein n=1 Tax=Quillaja saponaria TaxID=32244 RepID=A0AAD7PYQ1_QUISA|nr:HVA22-like protein [Quillaja saponaria]KAJ7971639.1 HVA22-like protein [Quillaja saponaria]
MLGEFITRCLILFLGYAYPAVECYKTLEKNRVGNEELRFWCQYWIIVAILTVLERILDTFISWIPMYDELKLALFIYLWYPKTKGTGFVYESVLRPFIARHDTYIDRKLLAWRAWAWDLAIFYWENCTQLGQSAFFQVLQYLGDRSANPRTKKTDDHGPSAPQQTPSGSSLFRRQTNKQTNQSNKNKKGPPTPSAPPLPGFMINRSISETPKSKLVQVHLNSQTEYLQVMEEFMPELAAKQPASGTSSPENNHLNQKHSQAPARPHGP